MLMPFICQRGEIVVKNRPKPASPGSDKSTRKTGPRPADRSDAPEAIANSLMVSPREIRDDQLRSLVRRTAHRIGPERLVRILSEVRAALRAEDLAGARRAGNRCRTASHREVMEQLLTLAARGYYANAANLALQAGLFAYELTLDHLYAFYEYEHDIGQ